MAKKIMKSDQSDIDPIELIESLHDLITKARDGEPPISFIDSLALTSLTKTLEYIDMSIEIDSLDYRTRFFLSEIRNFADGIAFRLSIAFNAKSRLNYNYPIAYPLACIIPAANARADSDMRYSWIMKSLEQIETEGELPDDIDSTWSALFGLSMHSWTNQAPPARIFADCIRNLESVRQAGSSHIFNTWFINDMSDDSEWKSTDIVAMSSVVAFFDAIDPTHLPNARSFIFDRLIAYLRNPIESLWFSDFYHSLPMAIYMISRCAWPGEQRLELSSHLIRILQTDNPDLESARVCPENATDISLYLASLLRLTQLDQNAHAISEFQSLAESCMSADSIGMTLSDPLYIHSLRGCKTTYAMSSVISSLLMFESMFGMIHFLKKEKTMRHASEALAISTDHPLSASPILSPYSSSHTGLIDKVMETLKNFEVLKDKKEMIERLISGTDFCICLDICMAMLGDDIQSAEDALTTHALGLCAYFLYDKIYDRELPPSDLPILFLTNAVFQTQLQQQIDELDARNIDIPEEILSVLSDTDISYYVIAERGSDSPLFLHSKKSMGTSLIPILCMIRAGISTEAAGCVMRFFEHFNLARQISDDAKDARQDQDKSMPKITTVGILGSQRNIEHAIFRETLYAKHALDSIVRIAARLPNGCAEDDRLRSIYYILRKRLDEFLIKALRAKWELAVIKGF